MSLLKRCDICGKAEPSVKFDEGPLRLQIPNFEQRPYNLFLTLEIEDDADTRRLEEMRKPEFIAQKMMEAIQKGLTEEDEITEDMMPPATLFKNPYPKICNTCMREMIKLVQSYGAVFGNPKI